MIIYVEGNYFSSPAQVLVNTVNTVGVMGKGLAKEFKRIYPEMFEKYQELCESGKLKIGKLFLYKSPNKWVLNFPTKKHWRYPSRPEYIEAGLKEFRSKYSMMGINSIAFPALGCGNGELDFESEVKPLMEKYLSNLPISIYIYHHNKNYYVPEHLTPDLTREWLRSEPQFLPFSEVWEDIIGVLNKKQRFYTLFKKNEFEARLSIWQDLEVIKIYSSNNSYNIYKNDILDLWQQLRRFGFITSLNAPSGLEKSVSYLAPILIELPYIEIVKLTYHRNRNKLIGLQYIEPLHNHFHQKNKSYQLSLF